MPEIQNLEEILRANGYSVSADGTILDECCNKEPLTMFNFLNFVSIAILIETAFEIIIDSDDYSFFTKNQKNEFDRLKKIVKEKIPPVELPASEYLMFQ